MQEIGTMFTSSECPSHHKTGAEPWTGSDGLRKIQTDSFVLGGGCGDGG